MGVPKQGHSTGLRGRRGGTANVLNIVPLSTAIAAGIRMTVWYFDPAHSKYGTIYRRQAGQMRFPCVLVWSLTLQWNTWIWVILFLGEAVSLNATHYVDLIGCLGVGPRRKTLLTT